KLQPLIDRAQAGGENPLELAIFDGAMSSEDVTRFWDDFVPMLGGEIRTRFDTLPELRRRLQSRFTRKQQRALYRLLGRFSLILVAQLEPLYLHRGAKPEIPVNTYFQLWMLVQHIIGCGK